MKQINPEIGGHINEAVQQLRAAADEHGEAFMLFNELRVEAKRGDAQDEILDKWNADVDARAKAYRLSPEGIAATLASDERRRDAQAKHDALMTTLPKLNFNDADAVLDWLCEMQDPSDHTGVIVRRKTIVEAFAKHHYIPNMDCGDEYRKGHANSMFRYIVGQALDGLERGPAIHHIIHKFTADWKKQFGTVTV